MSEVPRICLGTAKLGLPEYPPGTAVRLAPVEKDYILREAFDLGVRCFDTAAAYGDAEDWLRSTWWILGRRFVTKVTPYLLSSIEPRANERRWDWVLLHNPTVEELRAESVLSALELFVNGGQRVGASVYGVEEAAAALDCPLFSALQVPWSIYDQRHTETLKRARLQGVTSFARGPFLQGIGLIEDKPLRDVRIGMAARAHGWDLEAARDMLEGVRLEAEHRQVPLLDLHLAAAMETAADYVVVGVSSALQLRQVADAARAGRVGPVALRWTGEPLVFGSVWRRG